MNDDVLNRLKATVADRYTIERELGSGGMATVYLAHDLKHDRQVALKVMRPELSAILGGERFLREVSIAAKLSHPHILALYDSGEAEGFLFYVMPYVEGESLRVKLDRERQLSVEEAISLTRQIGAAVGYAHEQGVIHRDIKPENILLHKGVAVVADFGIALAVKTAGGDRLTETGLSLGTPAYMSPEQAAGDPNIDGRSDVYSLACVLYEMLAGEPPFTGPSPQAVLARHMVATAPSITTVRSAVSQPVAAAITKALGKAPADRYESASAFCEALLAEVVEPEPKSVAVLPFANMSDDPEAEYFSDGMTEEIINALTQLKDLRVAARTSSFAFKGKTPEIADVGAKLKVATVLEGSIRKAGTRLRVTAQLVNVADGYHLWSERYDREMEDVFAIQDDIARAIASKLQVTLAGGAGEPLVKPQTDSLEAYDLYLKGRFFVDRQVDAKGEDPRKGIGFFEQALALDPDYALAHAGLADAYSFLGIVGPILPPEQALPKARAAALRALALDDTLAETHCALAWILTFYDFDWAGAEKHFRRAIELAPSSAAAHWRYGFYLVLVRGRFDEAVAEGRRAVELEPLSAIIITWLALILMYAGRYEEAITQLRKAVELDPSQWHPHHILAHTYFANSMYPESIAAGQTAIAVAGPHPWNLMFLALAHAASGKTAEAEGIYDELLARTRREYVQPCVFAILSAGLGRKDAAFEWLDRAYDERDGLLTILKVARPFDPLRDDPRFDALVKRMGLEE